MLLRTPAFSYGTDPLQSLEQCLGLPIFRQAIQLASIDLYRELGQSAFNYQKLNAKTKISLWKYWNRMRFRPTPFGLFAAFSVVHWHPHSTLLRTDDVLKFHIRNDFKKVQQLTEKLWAQDTYREAYIANDSLYPVQNTLRYLSFVIESGTGKRHFYLDAIGQSEYLTAVLNHCSMPLPASQIIEKIIHDFQFSETESSDYVHELIQSKVLQPVTQLNITGNNTKFSDPDGRMELEDIKALSMPTDGTSLYVNTERVLNHDRLNEIHQKTLKDAIHCLRHLCPASAPAELNNFKTAFCNRYDRQCVPLLQALDPEIGVGYAGLAFGRNSPALLKNSIFETEQQPDKLNKWTRVHTLLMQKWNTASSSGIIHLTPSDLSELTLPDVLLPNSLSVLFRVINDQILIESAGGITGTSLSGRFTPMNAEVYETIKALAINEESANPEAIIAEIAHIGDPHTTNIDRRECLYAYEIPVLCGSVVSEENKIILSDLWVSIENNEVLLWSKKHQKRIVPRLSSAFNYLRSELPVFRFLCDLQHQGLHSDLNFNLDQFFPGLSYYPRVVFDSSILQLATWVLHQTTIDEIAKTDVQEQSMIILLLAKSLKWPRYISLSEHDNQLIFDIENEEDRSLFAAQFKRQNKITIREFLFEHELSAIVRNKAGKPFVNQFSASVYHSKNIYRGYPLPFNLNNTQTNVQRLFVPGSEWLFYKLYVHPARSNEVLLKHILKGTRILRTQGLIKKWFFVRYNDPQYHLRMRLQLAPKHTGMALSRFEKVFEELTSSGIIRGYNLDTYERELERYTPQLIGACEDFFCASSSLIISWLESITSDESDFLYYRIVFTSLRLMLDVFEWSTDESIDFFKQLYEGFAPAIMHGKTANRAQVRQKYRELTIALADHADLSAIELKALKKSKQGFIAATHNIADLSREMVKEKRRQLLADLIHMHLNRLFVDNSQKQELIIYYSFWKLLESEAALLRYQSSLPFTFKKMFIDPV